MKLTMQKDNIFPPLTTFMNIRTDYGFKQIFGSIKNKHLLVRLLNALLGDKLTINDVEFHDKEILPAEERGKRIIYDVYCTSQVEDYVEFLDRMDCLLPDGIIDKNDKKKGITREHHFILEMQNEYEPPLEDRVLYYTSKPVASQGKRGWDYRLDPVVTIVVTNFDFPHMSKKLVRHMGMADWESGELFTDKMRIICLSLKQMKDKDWDECKTEIEQILYLINNMDKLDKDSKAYKGLEYGDFFDAAETSSMASEEAVAYSQSLQKLRAAEEGIYYASKVSYSEGVEKGYIRGMEKGMQQGMEKGMQQGMEKGMQQGMEKGMQKERLDGILFMKSIGVSLEKIANHYGMSIEDIERLS